MSPTLPRPVVESIARYAVRPLSSLPPRVRRSLLDVISRVTRVPGGVSVARQARGGVFGDLVAREGSAEPARILYLHGGAYEAGSPLTHRNVMAKLALRSGHAVFAPAYRLSPEHPAPAALEDALSVYEAMVAELDGGVALAGDSAGGGLAVALALAARDRGIAAPRRLALISPWVDLTMSGASYTANERSDAMLARGHLERAARGYTATLGAEDPGCSPLRADLAGLPPTLIHAGSNEMFLSDAEKLARRAEEAEVDVELHVFDGLWHDFHVYTGMLREADEALDELGAFLGRI